MLESNLIRAKIDLFLANHFASKLKLKMKIIKKFHSRVIILNFVRDELYTNNYFVYVFCPNLIILQFWLSKDKFSITSRVIADVDTR